MIVNFLVRKIFALAIGLSVFSEVLSKILTEFAFFQKDKKIEIDHETDF